MERDRMQIVLRLDGSDKYKQIGYQAVRMIHGSSGNNLDAF